MKLLASGSRAFYIVALFALLAGCGRAQQPPLAALALSRPFYVGSTVVHRNPEKSWMLPGAQKQQSLLYVSNQGNGSVTVYTYLNGGGLVLVGTLTGFLSPVGMCTDSHGNVWIPDGGSMMLYEYAHGGTTPIATIKQDGGYPDDCSVDANTGKLAVANFYPHERYRQQSGYVVVYTNGQKPGIRYGPFGRVYFLAYDNQSNLYVDGTPCESGCYSRGGPPGLFRLQKGGSEFAQLTLSGGTLFKPSAINWIKPTLLLGDQNFQGQGTNGAYKFLVSGSTATVVGTLPFNETQQAYGFWRRAGNVVVPDYAGNIVRIYSLSTGALISILTTGISMPFGAVVSQ